MILDATKAMDRALPHDTEAEKGVLGSIMLKPDVLDEVSPILKPGDFFDKPRRRFYEVSLEIHNGGKVVDALLVKWALEAAGEFERLGGMGLLLDIAESAPTAANAVHYAKRMRDRAILRETITAAHAAIVEAHDPSANAQGLLARNVDRFGAIGEARIEANHITASQVAAAALDGIQYRIENRGKLDGVGFGLHEVARLIGRMRPQDFAVLAARTSGGKSALGSGIIEHAVDTQGIPTLLITLEMSGVEYLDRLLSARSGVAGERIRDGVMSAEERKLIVEHASDFEDWPLLIDDTPLRTMADIAAQARMLKRQGRLEFLVIDHIGNIEKENPRQTDYEHMSKVSRRLKVLARELNIVVLGLCQINRQAEHRGDPRPKLSDIKATGSIEQDANIVMFIHRPELYAPDDEDLKGRAELHVLKNRSGRTGVVPLRWNGDTTTFLSAAREWEGLE